MSFIGKYFCCDNKGSVCFKNNVITRKKLAFTFAEGATHVDMPPTKAKFAFTLAEVLITLGIIGIVAAMTIPTLITNYQKKVTVTRLKGAYSQLYEAIKMSEADNGEVSGWDFAQPNWFDNYISQYIKYQKDTFKDLSDENAIPYKQVSGSRETGLALLRPGFGGSRVYTLLNGVDIIVFDKARALTDAYKATGIIIDINGVNSKPNQFGKDAFYFELNYEHGFIPMGKWKTPECTPPNDGNPDRNWYKTGCIGYGCNKNGRGMYCAGLIMSDNWTIANDYPW